jgi:hypothetical protein
MLGNMLGDKKGAVNIILAGLGGGATEEKPALSSAMGNGGETPEMQAKHSALKEFFAAGNAGNWSKAAQALGAFVDLHDIAEDEMEDDEY